MRHLIVVNPRAGRGRSGWSEATIARAFQRRGLQFDLIRTEGRGHATSIVRDAEPAYDAVIAAGGDGTIHEVLQGLDLERHRFGLVPGGTGNDLAWALSWPSSIEGAVERISEGQTRSIDLGLWRASGPGETHGGRFHTVLGLGFPATVNAASHRIRGLRGPAVYLAALLKSLPRFRSMPLTMTWDGGRFEGSTAVAVIANSARTGGAFLLAPTARLDDGRLDLVVLTTTRLLSTLLLLPRSLRGTHVSSPNVRLATGTAFRIEAPRGIPAYVDGEFVAHDLREFEIHIAPGSLAVF
jgi:diacylglycerol kinase (ATP)